jgi:RHS repeat-associated protein
MTDHEGRVHEHVEYYPYGEVWRDSRRDDDPGPQPRTPAYLFTSKEFDPETRLHYFGARYYDAKLARWASTDPALLEYVGDDSRSLGVRAPANLSLYGYSWGNPVVLKDPDGRAINLAAAGIGAAIGAAAGAAIYTGVSLYRHEEITARGLLGATAGGAVAGGVAGLTLGASLIVQAGGAGAAGVYGGATNRAVVSSGDLAQTFDANAMQTDFAIGVGTFGLVKGAGATGRVT